MTKHALCSLLPRGTKTWQGPRSETTIDLVLASAEMADDIVRCATHPTEHGSDHRAIVTSFDVATPEREDSLRPLFKNAPWKKIRARVAVDLGNAPVGKSVQQESDKDKAITEPNNREGIVIATRVTVRRDTVGIGEVALDTRVQEQSRTTYLFSIKAGARSDFNAYYAELIAAGIASESVPTSTVKGNITILTRNYAAVLAIGRPRQQYGQNSILKIYKEARRLRKRGNAYCEMGASVRKS